MTLIKVVGRVLDTLITVAAGLLWFSYGIGLVGFYVGAWSWHPMPGDGVLTGACCSAGAAAMQRVFG